MLTLNEKLELISALESERLSEDLIEGVIHSIEHPEDWHHFETIEEANNWLNSDDEEDSDEND